MRYSALLFLSLLLLTGCNGVFGTKGRSYDQVPQTVSKTQYDNVKRQAAQAEIRHTDCVQGLYELQSDLKQAIDVGVRLKAKNSDILRQNTLLKAVLVKMDRSSHVQMQTMSSPDFLVDSLRREKVRLDKFLGIKRDLEAGVETIWEPEVVYDKIDESRMMILYLGYTLTLMEYRSVDFDELLEQMMEAKE